jgi:hypothetical protein
VILKIQKLANGHNFKMGASNFSLIAVFSLDQFYQFAINCNSNLRQGLLNL